MSKPRSNELRPTLPPDSGHKPITGNVFDHIHRQALEGLKNRGWTRTADGDWRKRNPDCPPEPVPGEDWFPWLRAADMNPEDEQSRLKVQHIEQMRVCRKQRDIDGALLNALFVGHSLGMGVVGHRQKRRYRKSAELGGDGQATSAKVLRIMREWEAKPESAGRKFAPRFLESHFKGSTPAGRRAMLKRARESLKT